jgi:hypothetical protein
MDPVTLLRSASSLTSRGQIRRLVPTAALVFLVVALVASGAPTREPQVSRVLHWASKLGVVDLVLLLLLVAASSLFLQPLFRYSEAVLEGAPQGMIFYLSQRIIAQKQHRLDDARGRWEALKLSKVRSSILAFNKLDSMLTRSPSLDKVTMTTLGDILAAADEYASNRYGLDTRITLPRLLQLLPDKKTASFKEREEDMQFAVDLAIALLIGGGVSLVLVVHYPLWLILPTALFFLSFIAYRNSLVAAVDYAEAKRVLFDLYRFRLYEALRLPVPEKFDDEYHLGQSLSTGLWRGFGEVPFFRRGFDDH